MPEPTEHEARTQALIHISKAHREAMQHRFKTEWWISAYDRTIDDICRKITT
ncbi:hypothetical protein [Photobacterium gaetbulicola]|uniref:hypothetical protein n=1 Tax=Photobacterium gaetbulicola TaxID=1295392 RepID=UPI000A97F87C|nr:hypothetical protein [Photobacterium gaetbulicola]